VARTGHEVVCVRHGETEWSLDGRHTGTSDIALTEHGREVACELGPRLAGHEFATVFSSPLRRSLETAGLAGFDAGRVEVLDDLREWNYGDFEGLTTPQIREDVPGWLLWRDGCPGGEQAADVGARADRVIDRIRSIDGDVLVFGHGHYLRVFGARWAELPPMRGVALGLETATLSTLGWEREVPVIWGWNCG
jgi:broad specificity phosphatase PhoE